MTIYYRQQQQHLKHKYKRLCTFARSVPVGRKHTHTHQHSAKSMLSQSAFSFIHHSCQPHKHVKIHILSFHCGLCWDDQCCRFTWQAVCFIGGWSVFKGATTPRTQTHLPARRLSPSFQAFFPSWLMHTALFYPLHAQSRTLDCLFQRTLVTVWVRREHLPVSTNRHCLHTTWWTLDIFSSAFSRCTE